MEKEKNHPHSQSGAVVLPGLSPFRGVWGRVCGVGLNSHTRINRPNHPARQKRRRGLPTWRRGLWELGRGLWRKRSFGDQTPCWGWDTRRAPPPPPPPALHFDGVGTGAARGLAQVPGPLGRCVLERFLRNWVRSVLARPEVPWGRSGWCPGVPRRHGRSGGGGTVWGGDGDAFRDPSSSHGAGRR